MNNSCAFCRIGQTHSLEKERKLSNGKEYFIMLAANPQTQGHSLVIPKRHFDCLEDIPYRLLGLLFKQAIKVGKLLEKKLAAKAFIIKVNNKLYQLECNDKGHINHIHFHVIPRYKKGEKLAEDPVKVAPVELMRVKKMLTRDLSARIKVKL